MSCWALIAIKNMSFGKERLAGALPPAARRRLIRTMLDQVLDSLNASRSVQRMAIVTSEQVLTTHDVTLISDVGGGLNASIAHAVSILEAAGASELLVLHGDLPLVTSVEIDELVAQGRRSGLALAPDRQGRGTNAIYLKAGSGFEFHFGPDSFELHRAEAMYRDLVPALVELPGFAFDVDEPADLEQLRALRGATYRFLSKHGDTHNDDQCHSNTV